MAKKVNALVASVRDEECDHKHGFPYRGSIPCTGPQICPMCNSWLFDAVEWARLTKSGRTHSIGNQFYFLRLDLGMPGSTVLQPAVVRG